MTLTQKKTAKTERRCRRAQRTKIAIAITHHLISPSLSAKQLKVMLARFAKLQAGKAS